MMMSKKVWPFAILLMIGGVFWAFKSLGKTDDTSMAKQQELLAKIGVILERGHYDPKKIDDAFSQDIFKKYLETLDGDKDIFISSDIESLKQYQNTIDDEIHGSPIKFYPAVEKIFTQRVQETADLCKTILSKPFDFSVDESVQLDRDKLNYPSNDADKKEVWRKRLKYMALGQYIDLQEQRTKSVIDSVKNQTDIQLEIKARQKVLQVMSRIYTRMQKTYTDNEYFNSFVYTITTAMEPHTEYFPPLEKRSFDEDMSGKFYGIGAQLKQDDDDIKIVSIIPGTPAWKSGKLQVNDAIVKVGQASGDMIDISGYGVTDAVKLIRGNKGTIVRLTLKKINGILDTVTLTRDEIVQDEIYARSILINDNGKKIGYINLPEFYGDFEKPDGRRCSVDLANEVKKLKAENVEGIVIDIRNNGGGYLYEVPQMVGLFIKNGPVVQVKNRDGSTKVLNDNDTSVLYTGPLAVLVNEQSASASEIFAAALQDYKRAVIIGSTTYGKGTVQTQISLGNTSDELSPESNSGSLKLTIEKFYRITGASTQLKGVTPDIILPDSYEYAKIREKDNPSSLKWDQIQPSNYTSWNSNNNLAKVENEAQLNVNNNKVFSTLQTNTQWLDKTLDKEYELNINKYKSESNLIKKVVSEDDSVSKLQIKMNADFLSVDKDKYSNNPDQSKAERYRQWLSLIQKDIYVDETVKVISDIAKTPDLPNIANH